MQYCTKPKNTTLCPEADAEEAAQKDTTPFQEVVYVYKGKRAAHKATALYSLTKNQRSDNDE